MVLFYWLLRRIASHNLKNILEKKKKINHRNSRLEGTFMLMLKFPWCGSDMTLVWFDLQWTWAPFPGNYRSIEADTQKREDVVLNRFFLRALAKKKRRFSFPKMLLRRLLVRHSFYFFLLNTSRHADAGRGTARTRTSQPTGLMSVSIFLLCLTIKIVKHTEKYIA